jgi:2-C-methyl-D-erythritol 4-phosphate cytidylyltransferase
MKRGNYQGCVEATVERENLWHALTPQAFPFAELFAGYTAAAEQGRAVTDEAMAIESSGGQVKLVPGSQDNIKITRPEDLQLAALYLQAQANETHGEK